jgi:hypothetical protein
LRSAGSTAALAMDAIKNARGARAKRKRNDRRIIGPPVPFYEYGRREVPGKTLARTDTRLL